MDGCRTNAMVSPLREMRHFARAAIQRAKEVFFKGHPDDAIWVVVSIQLDAIFRIPTTDWCILKIACNYEKRLKLHRVDDALALVLVVVVPDKFFILDKNGSVKLSDFFR